MKSIIAAAVFCLVAVSSAQGDVPVDIAKITCRDFLLDTITLPDSLAYWISGYLNGKRGGNTVVDVVGLRDHVNKVEQYCLQNQDSTVMKAAETVLGGDK
jgi:acid stress chaperone HdeB